LECDERSKEDEAKDVDTIMVAQINEKVAVKLKKVIPTNEEKGAYQFEVRIGPIIVLESDNEGIAMGKLIRNKEPKVKGATNNSKENNMEVATCELQAIGVPTKDIAIGMEIQWMETEFETCLWNNCMSSRFPYSNKTSQHQTIVLK
jgi:hypothetical protein